MELKNVYAWTHICIPNARKELNMSLTINTNLSSMIVQSNLAKSTNQLNNAIERMTTGYKINHASDNAAGYSIAKGWEAQLSSLDVAAENAAMGSDMLSTLEDNCTLIQSHLQRIRDLTEQAANGTYGADSRTAIQSEIQARMDEIDRIAANCEYNGISLMSGTGANKSIQVGTKATNGSITLEGSLFDGITSAGLGIVAADCAGTNASGQLATIDTAIKNLSNRVTKIGAAQNRIESAIESIGVQSENITSSLSTLRDADVATESSNYIKAQILQQASATLLATANQSPSIALNLL